MTTLMQASNEWMKRPADERFVDLPSLHAKVSHARHNSVQRTVSTRQINVTPHAADPIRGITVENETSLIDPTHWSFGQLASLSGAPASYLRKLPSPIVADAMNYGLRFNRDAEEVKLLATETPVLSQIAGEPIASHTTLRAATGPNYGRVWNDQITGALMQKFGDGRTGDFRVPGEFGKDVPITKENTTIYGSDRDIFIFLADENNRIDIADRRDGKAGSLARGFFVWNSEEGSKSIGAAFFLFDFVCMNRIVWGVQDFKEIRLRHTAGAPDRWLEEIAPVLTEYTNASAQPIEQTIREAQKQRVDDDLNKFLANRFTKSESKAVQQAHIREEGRPIENVWDAVTGVTAHAKTIPHMDARVDMERKGGNLLDLVSID